MHQLDDYRKLCERVNRALGDTWEFPSRLSVKFNTGLPQQSVEKTICVDNVYEIVEISRLENFESFVYTPLWFLSKDHVQETKTFRIWSVEPRELIVEHGHFKGTFLQVVKEFFESGVQWRGSLYIQPSLIDVVDCTQVDARGIEVTSSSTGEIMSVVRVAVAVEKLRNQVNDYLEKKFNNDVQGVEASLLAYIRNFVFDSIDSSDQLERIEQAVKALVED